MKLLYWIAKKKDQSKEMKLLPVGGFSFGEAFTLFKSFKVGTDIFSNFFASLLDSVRLFTLVSSSLTLNFEFCGERANGSKSANAEGLTIAEGWHNGAGE